MTLFSPADIERVKSTVDLVALVQSSGVTLKRQGRNWLGRCPFHADKTPSLVITPSKGLWNCLGGCKGNGHPSGGDAIGWLVRKEGLTFREAMKKLGADPSGVEPAPQSLSAAAVVPVADVWQTVITHYHDTLLSSKKAQDYLRKRGLWDEALVSGFKIGYADGSLITRLGKSPLKKELQRLGIITESNREQMRGCLVVPIYDGAQAVNLYGRHTEKAQHLYLPGPRRGLLNGSGAKDATRLVLCESVLDALSLILLGEPGALPLWGVNGWTESYDAFMRSWRGQEVVIALDADDTGKKAAVALAEQLAAYKPRVLDLTPYKDPNALLCGASHPKEAWAKCAGAVSVVVLPTDPLAAKMKLHHLHKKHGRLMTGATRSRGLRLTAWTGSR